ncbi:MAG TPA: YceI family protein [Longimicrobium sp.]
MTLLNIKTLVALVAFPTLIATAAPEPAARPVPVLPAAAPATYKIDPVHSELSFRIRHLVGRVSGTFTEWGGTIVADPANLSNGSVNVTVQMSSIHTLNAQRDAHLKTPDFFAADSFPTMTFRSTRVVQTGNRLRVHGDLTLRGRTRPVILDGRYTGRVAKDPWGKERIAFTASTNINRREFGVAFNQMLEGTAVVGDEVAIEIAVEAVKE